jgi:hypothetical protein
MRQYRSAATTRARAAPWLKSAAFSVIISAQALMWAETRSGVAEAKGLTAAGVGIASTAIIGLYWN